MAPKAGKNCVSCGKCASLCPVGAIPLSDPSRTEKNYIGFMRCVAVCPNGARKLSAPVKQLVKLALKAAMKERKAPEFYI